MKKFIFCLVLLGFISAGHSQILLKEAKVDYRPESMKIDPVTNSLVIQIHEKTAGEFQKDPLQFMKGKFDIQKFLVENKKEKFEEFQINFKSRKGYLAARFDEKGDLVSSFQKFKDVRLPETARLQVLEKYRDAKIIGNKYLASTKGWELNKAHYLVKIKDGNKIKRLRLDKDKDHYTLTSL